MKKLIKYTIVCLSCIIINNLHVYCTDIIPIYSFNILGPSSVPKTDDSLKDIIQYSITTDKSEYGYCEPIVVSATFENISNKNLMYFDSDFLWDIQPIVSNVEGGKTPYTVYGNIIFSDFEKGVIDLSGVGQHTLEPKQNVTYKILINRIFDMSQYGKYQIQLSRVVFDKETKAFCKIPSCTQEIEISERYGKYPAIDYKPKPIENLPSLKQEQ